jgi:hypothetical protein
METNVPNPVQLDVQVTGVARTTDTATSVTQDDIETRAQGTVTVTINIVQMENVDKKMVHVRTVYLAAGVAHANIHVLTV